MSLRIHISLVLLLALVLIGDHSHLIAAQNSVGGGANGASIEVASTVLGVPTNVSVPTLAPVALRSQGGSSTNQLASANVQLGVGGVVTVLSTDLIVNSTSGNISSDAHAESTYRGG